MVTTIQINDELLSVLKMMKISEKESYENIIWDLIEDSKELSAETKRNIAQSEKEIKQGKTISLEALKKKYKL
jgi:predicted CopG family antitoxin